MRKIVFLLLVNSLLSWIVLSLLIPPFRMYTLPEFLDVLFWQGIGTVGWPIAIFGGLVSFLFQGTQSGLGAVLILLIYPAMLFLLILVLMSKRCRWWGLILLHLLLTFSFAAVWFQVLNGYDFMPG